MQTETWAAGVDGQDSTMLHTHSAHIEKLRPQPGGLIPNFSLFREPSLARVDSTLWKTIKSSAPSLQHAEV